jgi:hypothetical protein
MYNIYTGVNWNKNYTKTQLHCMYFIAPHIILNEFQTCCYYKKTAKLPL